jgi:hypothetical protein
MNKRILLIEDEEAFRNGNKTGERIGAMKTLLRRFWIEDEGQDIAESRRNYFSG